MIPINKITLNEKKDVKKKWERTFDMCRIHYRFIWSFASNIKTPPLHFFHPKVASLFFFHALAKTHIKNYVNDQKHGSNNDDYYAHLNKFGDKKKSQQSFWHFTSLMFLTTFSVVFRLNFCWANVFFSTVLTITTTTTQHQLKLSKHIRIDRCFIQMHNVRCTTY